MANKGCPYKHLNIAFTVLLQLKIYIDISKGISWFASLLGDGGGIEPYSEGLYSRDLGQIGILGGNSLHIQKIVNMNITQKK